MFNNGNHHFSKRREYKMKGTKTIITVGIALAIAACTSIQILAMDSKTRKRLVRAGSLPNAPSAFSPTELVWTRSSEPIQTKITWSSKPLQKDITPSLPAIAERAQVLEQQVKQLQQEIQQLQETLKPLLKETQSQYISTPTEDEV